MEYEANLKKVYSKEKPKWKKISKLLGKKDGC